MRRPRSRLEVSTFPFLAVLLCAMGSLMLFLFIMDRRAKIVERNRALATREAMTAAKNAGTKAEQEARQAEWEKARDKLHQLLLEQQRQISAEAESIENNVADANKKLQVVQTKYVAMQEKVAGEASRILMVQSELDKERAGLNKIDTKEVASKAELAKATEELLELKAAFELLKAQRERDKEVYSVVPYRGKRGDMRPPIYVECTLEGMQFHPEKRILPNYLFTPAALISEVERRAGPLAAQKPSKQKEGMPAEERKGPYVLFLVRPDGIPNYYKAQASLRGLEIDFGYELVDEQWVLDFSGSSGNGAYPAPAPSKLASQSDPSPRRTAASTGTFGSGAFPGTGSRESEGGSPGSGLTGTGSGERGPGGRGSGSSGPGGSGGGDSGLTEAGQGGPYSGYPVPGGSVAGSGNNVPGSSGIGPKGNGTGDIRIPNKSIGSSGIGNNSIGGSGIGGKGSGGFGPGGSGVAGAGMGGNGHGRSGPGISAPVGFGPGGTGGTGVAGGPGSGVPSSFGAPGGGPDVGFPSFSGQSTPGAVSGGAGTGQSGGVAEPYASGGPRSPGTGGGVAPGASDPSMLARGNGAPGTGNALGAVGSNQAYSVTQGSGNGATSPGGQSGGSQTRDPSFAPVARGFADPGAKPDIIASSGTPSSYGYGSMPANPSIQAMPGTGPFQASASGTPGTPGTQGMSAERPGEMRGNGSPGGAGEGSSGPNLSRAPLPASFVSDKPSRASGAPVLSRVLGNRDFQITIDCYANHVNVFPGGMQYRFAGQNLQATEQAFVQSVVKLIERRQASVRPGETPYRPILRFQVEAEGLRTYYHVYPLLETLRLPMTRENVEE